MVADEHEILTEIRELKSWLYGKNGFEGDIPEMKANLKQTSITVQSHEADISLLKEREQVSRKQVLGISGVVAIIMGILQFLATKFGWK